MTWTRWFALGALAIPLALGGCPNKSNEAGDTVRIALAGPMSGSAAAFGEMTRKAAELKVKEINEKGGINGKLVELVVEDDRGDTTEAANISRKLAGDRSISAVIGHFNSTCSNAAKEEYNRKKVVQFTPASTNVSVCVGSEWTFRNLYRDDYQGIFLAGYAKTVLNATRVAAFYDNDDYGKGLVEAFQKEAARIGLEVIAPVPYVRERTQDFKPLVGGVVDKRPDAIFVAGLYNEAALIAKAARQDLQLTAPILAGDGVMNQKFIEIAGTAAEGTFVTTPFLFEAAADNPQAKVFLDSFRAANDKDPDTWAALAYDAVGMILAGIAEVGADREKLREWMAGITTPEKAYAGVTGATYFDKEGDCYSKGAHVAEVKAGKFVAAEKQMKVEQ